MDSTQRTRRISTGYPSLSVNKWAGGSGECSVTTRERLHAAPTRSSAPFRVIMLKKVSPALSSMTSASPSGSVAAFASNVPDFFAPRCGFRPRVLCRPIVHKLVTRCDCTHCCNWCNKHQAGQSTTAAHPRGFCAGRVTPRPACHTFQVAWFSRAPDDLDLRMSLYA